MFFYILGEIKEPLYSLLIKIFNTFQLVFTPEKVKSYGKLNSNLTFYIITNLPGGLASQYDSALGYIERAIRKGYIPIIDLKNTKNDCLRDNNKSDIDNPWEYFFEQPFSQQFQKYYSLDEVYRSKRVVTCNTQHMVYKRVNKKNIKKRFLISQYIPVKELQYKFIKQKYEELFDGITNDVVGVYYRGTDYKSVGNWRPTGHAKVPTIKKFCDIVARDIEEWGGVESVFRFFL